jgi:hypothetical protein
MSDTTAAHARRAWTPGWILALTLVTLVSALTAASLDRFYVVQSRLPLWDMAGHGWGGVELLRALEQGRPLRFLDLLNRQDKWPFGYSLLLLPFLGLGDASFASATLLSTVLFAATPLLLLWAAREVEAGPPGLWGGLLASALFLSSPLLRLFAILIMREMAGAFFSLLALCLYLRARRLGTPAAWRLAGLASLALFLVKYNYALIWGASVLANEVWRLPPERRRELARNAARLLRPWGQPEWGRLVLALYLDLLLAATVLGINPGVGIYAGLVVGAVLFGARFLRDREAVLSRWRRLTPELRALLAAVVIPLWIWCLSPRPIHPKSIGEFLRNRAAGPPLFSLDSLSFYFRALARDYAPAPVLGALIVLLLIAALLGLRRSDEPFRVVALAVGLGLGLAILHPFKEARFLAVTAPLLMLAAALMLSRGWRPATRRRAAAGGLLCASVLVGIGIAAAHADLESRLAGDYRLHSARPGLWRPLDYLAEQAAGAPRVAVIGSFNELSDDLVRWWLATDAGARAVTLVKPLPRRLSPGTWLGREDPSRILAIQQLPGSQFSGTSDFRLYNAWQLAAIAALERDPAWRVKRRRRFEGLGMEVMVIEPSSRPAPARSPSPHPP